MPARESKRRRKKKTLQKLLAKSLLFLVEAIFRARVREAESEQKKRFSLAKRKTKELNACCGLKIGMLNC